MLTIGNQNIPLSHLCNIPFTNYLSSLPCHNTGLGKQVSPSTSADSRKQSGVSTSLVDLEECILRGILYGLQLIARQ